MREMKMRRAASGAESGREFERGGRRAAAAAVRGLLLKLAVCAAAAAAASAQTAPVYRIEEVAFKNHDALYRSSTNRQGRFTRNGLGCLTPYSFYYSGQRSPGDGGPASQAQLCEFRNMRTDGAGNIFIIDGSYQTRIRRIDAATGVIDTVFGRGLYADDEHYYDYHDNTDGYPHYRQNPHVVTDEEGRFVRFKDGAPAVEVVSPPIYGMDVDAAGNVFFSIYLGSKEGLNKSARGAEEG